MLSLGSCKYGNTSVHGKKKEKKNLSGPVCSASFNFLQTLRECANSKNTLICTKLKLWVSCL